MVKLYCSAAGLYLSTFDHMPTLCFGMYFFQAKSQVNLHRMSDLSVNKKVLAVCACGEEEELKLLKV